jgi:hypothetical protein
VPDKNQNQINFERKAVLISEFTQMIFESKAHAAVIELKNTMQLESL